MGRGFRVRSLMSELNKSFHDRTSLDDEFDSCCNGLLGHFLTGNVYHNFGKEMLLAYLVFSLITVAKLLFHLIDDGMIFKASF